MNETQITVVGNLTADPELRYTQNGKAVANFTLASTPSTFDRTTNTAKEGTPLFLRCSAWDVLGEHVAQTLKKGMRVIAQGNLGMKEYETKEGEKRTSTELSVQAIGPELRFHTAVVERAASATQSRNRGAQQAQQQPQEEQWVQPGQGAQQARQQPQSEWGGTPTFGDETPF